MAIRTGSVVDTCWARHCFISYSLRCTAAYKSSGRPREEESAVVSGDDGAEEEEGTRTANGSRVVVDDVGKAFVPGDSANSSKKMQRVFMVIGVVIVFMFMMCNIMVIWSFSLFVLQKSKPKKFSGFESTGGTGNPENDPLENG
jgi:hypothetical protein